LDADLEMAWVHSICVINLQHQQDTFAPFYSEESIELAILVHLSSFDAIVHGLIACVSFDDMTHTVGPAYCGDLL
jgi:hypothetical protein